MFTRKGWPGSAILNQKQLSNWLRVEHLPGLYTYIYIYIDIQYIPIPRVYYLTCLEFVFLKCGTLHTQPNTLVTWPGLQWAGKGAGETERLRGGWDFLSRYFPLKWRSFTSNGVFLDEMKRGLTIRDEFGGTPKASFVGGISWPFQVFFYLRESWFGQSHSGISCCWFFIWKYGVWCVIRNISSTKCLRSIWRNLAEPHPESLLWDDMLGVKQERATNTTWSHTCLLNKPGIIQAPKATCNKGRQFKIMIYLWCSWISLSNKFIMLMKRKD